MGSSLFQHDIFVFEHAIAEFETLLEFLSISAGHLAKEHSDYMDWHNKYQKRYPMVLDFDIGDGYIDDYLEGVGKYAHSYPRLLLNATMILACSLFEDNMRLIAKAMNHFERTKLQWDSLKGLCVVDKARKLLKDIGISFEDEEKYYSKFKNYWMVRNCIVHHDGLINAYRNSDKLLAYAVEADIAPTDPLYKPGDNRYLQLTDVYCRDVGDTLVYFFNQLYFNYPKRR